MDATNKKYLQFISDIHLEFYKNDKFPKFEAIKPGSTMLALLGDIGYPHSSNYKKFLIYHSKIFQDIFLISGNHEYYSSKKTQYTMKEIEEKIRETIKDLSNVHYLQKSSIQIDNLYFIGCTLWSDVQNSYQVENNMNDYQNIYVYNPRVNKSYITKKKLESRSGNSREKIKKGREQLKVIHIQNIHKDMLDWLFNEVEDNNDKNIIVLTHHAPSYSLLKNNSLKNELMDCYASNLDQLIKKYPQIKYWLFGHTHHCQELYIGTTKCMSNCMGYFNEQGKDSFFDSNKYILF